MCAPYKLFTIPFNLFSANAQGATRLSEMQAYELWKLEQDAKLIIKEIDKIESESSKPADDN